MSTHPPSEGAVFGVARQIQSDEARLQYLNQVCGDDTARRDRILRLLDGDKRDSFLEKPILAREATLKLSDLAEKEGRTVGPYKLLQQIGEGGFGIVYMAEQQRPVRRKVALKVIKPGMDTKQVIGRFEAERQALAMMDHPNIAKVFEAGTTESGRPYFVMELVKGIPITDYCDRQRLGTRQRLELFVKVCQAVQHAHQKGIIHRDIKPSNVLVTEHDGTPVPKVIDFGIAKAINQQLTERTLFTRFQQMVGTPMYMSPEQADLSGLDVDTRTDIYSLGVLLYELLTGATPFDSQRFSEVAYDEIRRVIREEEPPKPSTRVSSLGDTAISISGHRGTDPKKLTQLMRGELDWVIMKAMDKDRTRRYETSNSFGLDVQRFLDNEPVSAASPTAFYRFRKFTRRNTVAIAVTSAIVTSILIGLGAATFSYFRERDARQIAEERRQEAVGARGDAEQARAAEKEERMKAQANEQQALDSEQQARRFQYAADLNLAFSALERFDTTQVLKLLQRHVPATGQSDPRGWEWRHLWWKTHQSIATIQTHGTGWWGVRSFAISPDGRFLLVAGDVVHGSTSNWSLIKLVDLESLQITKTLPAIDTASITGLTYFSNDRTLAIDCLGYTPSKTFLGLTLMDIDGEKISRPISQLAGYGWPTTVAPDGSCAMGTFRGNEVRLVTIDDLAKIPTEGQALIVIARIRDTLHFRVFDFDGRQTDRSEAELEQSEHLDQLKQLLGEHWNEPQPTPAQQQKIHWLATKALVLPYREIQRLRCFDFDTGKELAKSVAFEVHAWSDSCERIRLSPDGQVMAVGCLPDQVLFLSVPELQTIQSIGVGGEVRSLAWSPDARLLAVGLGFGGGEIRDATSGELKLSLKGKSATPMHRVCFSDDGSLLATAAGDQSVVVWEVDTGDVWDVYSQDGDVSALAFLPSGKRLAAGDKAGNIRFWDISRPEKTELKQLTHALDVKYSRDGRLLATSSDGVVNLFDAESGELVAKLEPLDHRQADRHVISRDEFATRAPICFSPDGRLLAAGNGDHTATIYDVVSRKPLHVLRGHASVIRDITFSPDGKQVVTASSWDGTLRFWDPDTGSPGQIVPAEGDREMQAVQFSPDGKLIAYGNFAVHLRSLGQDEPLISGPRIGHVTCIQFSPRGNMLACGTREGVVRLYSVPKLELKHTFTGLTGGVNDLSFSADGVNLLAVCRGGIARIFNLTVMNEVGDVVHSSSDWLISGTFSPDGNSLAVVSRLDGVRQFHAISQDQVPRR